MKKILISLLVLISITTFNTFSFQAGGNIENKVLVDEEKMHDDVLYQYYNMDTSFDINQVKTKRDVYTYTVKQSNNAFLATWTMSNRDGYKFGTLMDIAKDYEAAHPGYIVLGGVNAEGYYNGELTNAFVQDGDVIRKDVSYESFKELIGFKKDGTVVIKQLPVSSEYLRLKVNDQSYDITKTNELPNDNEIALLTPDLEVTLSLNGYNVYECNYTMFRKSTQFPDPRGTLSGPNLGLFIKGSINKKVELSTISAVPQSKFYIVTNNMEVSAQMSEGLDIKCQFDYTDEFSDVRSMTGYMYKYLENGEVIPLTYVDTNDVGNQVVYNCDYYKTTSKERAGIGFKEDGSIVLLTTNTYRGGPTQYEVGAMFKELGCTDAYQFDGGGSVTFVKRNEQGEITMLNTPGDGSPRRIMSGLLIVTRDPGFTSYKRFNTSTSVTFTKKDGEVFNKMQDISITVDGKTIEVEKDATKVCIDGLNPNTKYEAMINYTLDGVKCMTKLECETKEFDPGLTINSDAYGFTFKLNQYDNSLTIQNIEIMIDDEHYEMKDVNELVVDNLNKNSAYYISYIVHAINPNNNKQYTFTIESTEYRTLSSEKPYIVSFTESRKTDSSIRVSYAYKDPDNLVSAAYLYFNNESIELTTLSGIHSFNDLDLTNNSYVIYLELEYEFEGRTYKVKSEKLTYNSNGCEHQIVVDEGKEPTCIEDGLTEGSHCSICNQKIQEQVIIPAVEHTWNDNNPKECIVCGAVQKVQSGGCNSNSIIKFTLLITVLTSTMYIIRRRKY